MPKITKQDLIMLINNRNISFEDGLNNPKFSGGYNQALRDVIDIVEDLNFSDEFKKTNR
jgi:hypothetical protein